MKPALSIIAFLVFLAFCLQPHAAEKATPAAGKKRIAVVVSRSNPVEAVEAKELERIFLREKVRWENGETITVYERSAEHPIRSQFSLLVFRKKPEDMAEYWLNLRLTRGLQAPQVCHSPTLLKRYLERVKGGIGYVYEDEVDEAMKVVRLLNPE